MNTYELTVKTHFSGAHRLRDYRGKCESLHGHNWKVTVKLGADQLNELGMVVDFTEVKELLEEVVGTLDHEYLNEVEPFDEVNPTTENLAAYISEELSERLPEQVEVTAVTCWESEKCGATYRSAAD